MEDRSIRGARTSRGPIGTRKEVRGCLELASRNQSGQRVHATDPQAGNRDSSDPIDRRRKTPLVARGAVNIWVPAFVGTTKKEFTFPLFHVIVRMRIRPSPRADCDGCAGKNAAPGRAWVSTPCAADEKLSPPGGMIGALRYGQNRRARSESELP